MKRQSALPFWPEILIPALPLLCHLVSWNSGLILACSGTIIFLVSASTVKFLGLIFKINQQSFLFMLASTAAVYVLNGFYELPASLVLSLCLMGPAGENKNKYNPKFSKIILKAVCFFALIAYLTAAQEILGGVLKLSFFQRVSGSFLLLSIPAFFWPASRKVKGTARRKLIRIQEVPAL